MTNGDRIRNMSNEELVEFIMGVREEFVNESFYYKIISGKRFEYTDDILDWLNSEEKEEEIIRYMPAILMERCAKAYSPA